MEKLSLKRASDQIVIGLTLLVTGILTGFIIRQGEVNVLKDINRELLRESEKKTWYLGKQFADYLKKTRA